MNVEVNAYVENNKFCVVNNTYESQVTNIYKGDGSSFELKLEPNEIKWFEIGGESMKSSIIEVLQQYDNFTELKEFSEYGNGHINDTYLLDYEGSGKVILQKINKSIFKRAE